MRTAGAAEEKGVSDVVNLGGGIVVEVLGALLVWAFNFRGEGGVGWQHRRVGVLGC